MRALGSNGGRGSRGLGSERFRAVGFRLAKRRASSSGDLGDSLGVEGVLRLEVGMIRVVGERERARLMRGRARLVLVLRVGRRRAVGRVRLGELSPDLGDGGWEASAERSAVLSSMACLLAQARGSKLAITVVGACGPGSVDGQVAICGPFTRGVKGDDLRPVANVGEELPDDAEPLVDDWRGRPALT
jgi:hypothetical protein